jgi:hypothetical protein
LARYLWLEFEPVHLAAAPVSGLTALEDLTRSLAHLDRIDGSDISRPALARRNPGEDDLFCVAEYSDVGVVRRDDDLALFLYASEHRDNGSRDELACTDLQVLEVLAASGLGGLKRHHARGTSHRDLHREKQAELSRELLDAEQRLAKADRAVGKPECGLKLARKLLTNSAETYRSVDDLTRRQWNQVFFQRLLLRPGEVLGAELTDTYGDMLSEQLARDLEKLTARPAALRGHGSSVSRIMELAGLEPATSWVRSRRSSS